MNVRSGADRLFIADTGSTTSQRTHDTLGFFPKYILRVTEPTDFTQNTAPVTAAYEVEFRKSGVLQSSDFESYFFDENNSDHVFFKKTTFNDDGDAQAEVEIYSINNASLSETSVNTVTFQGTVEINEDPATNNVRVTDAAMQSNGSTMYLRAYRNLYGIKIDSALGGFVPTIFQGHTHGLLNCQVAGDTAPGTTGSGAVEEGLAFEYSTVDGTWAGFLAIMTS